MASGIAIRNRHALIPGHAAGESFAVPVAEARGRFADLLSRVAYRGERVVITRHGKPLAALIPADDLELLERLEDEGDIRAAERALSEAKRKGTVPLAAMLRKLHRRR
jgi:prevent-host-death family protein